MASRTDIQQHFGRVQADSVKLAGALAPMGEWIETKTILTNAVLGAGAVNIVRYTVIGKTCVATFRLSQTGAGTASGSLSMTLPVLARSGLDVTGHGFIGATAGSAVLTVAGLGATSIGLFATSNSAGPSTVSDSVFGIDDNASWAAAFTVIYEIA